MNVHLDVHLDSICGGVRRWLGLRLLMTDRLGLSFRLHDPRKPEDLPYRRRKSVCSTIRSNRSAGAARDLQ
jgi:hypothetical protein